MRRAELLLAALALGLAGCPIPQPLPDYPPGTVTPPRIVVDDLLGDGAVTLVPAGCTTLAPYQPLGAGRRHLEPHREHRGALVRELRLP